MEGKASLVSCNMELQQNCRIPPKKQKENVLLVSMISLFGDLETILQGNKTHLRYTVLLVLVLLEIPQHHHSESVPVSQSKLPYCMIARKRISTPHYILGNAIGPKIPKPSRFLGDSHKTLHSRGYTTVCHIGSQYRHIF